MQVPKKANKPTVIKPALTSGCRHENLLLQHFQELNNNLRCPTPSPTQPPHQQQPQTCGRISGCFRLMFLFCALPTNFWPCPAIFEAKKILGNAQGFVGKAQHWRARHKHSWARPVLGFRALPTAQNPQTSLAFEFVCLAHEFLVPCPRTFVPCPRISFGL